MSFLQENYYETLLFAGVVIIAMFLWAAPAEAALATEFVMSVKTDNTGCSTDTQFEIPTDGVSVYSYDVDWTDDGTFDDIGVTGDITHDYGVAGTYDVVVRGTFPRIKTAGNCDPQKILEVKQWGNNAWTSMVEAFETASNLQITATDAPDLSGVTSMNQMFRQATNFTGGASMNTWDMSSVTDMSYMFELAPSFNQDIGSWDTSAVTNMSYLFKSATSFNQDISSWNTAAVTDMSGVFSSAAAFDQSLVRVGNSWNTAAVTTIASMFNSATSFNQDISSWDTSSLVQASGVFTNATNYNQPMPTVGSQWDMSNVMNISSMFAFATVFNQDISSWDTSSVTSLSATFYGASAFDQDISIWDTSSMAGFSQTFTNATAFNQDISSWDTSSIGNLEYTFQGATSFNQDISAWNTSNVTTMEYMFQNATSFDQNLGAWDMTAIVLVGGRGGSSGATSMFDGITLSTANYDATLTAWDAQALNANVVFDGGGSKYCNAATARANMIASDTWTITDGGVDVACLSFTGTAYTDEGITNIGLGKTVTMLVNGVVVASDTTDASGNFSIIGAPTTGDVVTFFIDGDTENGVTVTRYDGVTVAGYDIYQNTLIARTEDGTALSNTDLNTGNNADTDITDIYSDGATLATTATTELHVWIGDTFTPGGTFTANGGVHIIGTLDAGINTINAGGDFTNAGTFTPGTSTVNLTGTTQTLTGDTTFYNLSKTATAAETLTMTAGSTQTIAAGGTLTFDGSTGNVITIVSSTPATATTFDILATGNLGTIDYINVTDNNLKEAGTTKSPELAPANSTDGGNTTGWFTAVTTSSSGSSSSRVRSTTTTSGGSARTMTIERVVGNNDQITVTYPHRLDAQYVPNLNDYRIRTQEGSVIQVRDISITNDKLILSLSEVIPQNENVFLDYVVDTPRIQSTDSVDAETQYDVPVQTKQTLLQMLIALFSGSDDPQESGTPSSTESTPILGRSCSSVVDLTISDQDYVLFSNIPGIEIYRTTAANLSPFSPIFDRPVALESRDVVQKHIDAMPQAAKDTLCENIPTSVVRRGDSSPEAGWVQRTLNFGICADLFNDNLYGRRTGKTIGAFQSREGITSDESWGPETAATMRSVLGCNR